MDLSVWDDRKVADMEWEKYLKKRNRPYKPFEDLEANEKNLSDDHEWLIRFLYEAAERNENEKKEKEEWVSNQIEDKKNKKKKEKQK
ncbi:hypothetical protein Tco_0163767 [Tanacetum coccineum]